MNAQTENTSENLRQAVGADYDQGLLDFIDGEFARPVHPIKAFFNQHMPLFGMLKGLNITRAAILNPKKFTVKYPEEKLDLADAFRGKHELLVDPDGEQICICCNACATICPIDCIEIKSEKSENPDRKRDLIEYNIDLTKCLFCGLCQEVCPVLCLEMTKNYEYSDTHRGHGLLKVRMEDIIRKVSREEYDQMQAKIAADKPKPAAKKPEAGKE